MKSRGWEDNRRALFTIHFKHVNSKLGRQHTKGATDSRSQSIYELTVPTKPMMWMMWCVKVAPQHRGLRPLLFSNSGVGSFTSYKNQISASAVRRDLRFFVLIREVRTRDFPLSRPALFQLSQPGGSKWRQTAVMFTPYRIKSFLVQYEQQRHRTGTSRSRTSNVVPYRLTERVRWTKSSISHKHIQTTTINENRSLISSIKINKNR